MPRLNLKLTSPWANRKNKKEIEIHSQLTHHPLNHPDRLTDLSSPSLAIPPLPPSTSTETETQTQTQTQTQTPPGPGSLHEHIPPLCFPLKSLEQPNIPVYLSNSTSNSTSTSNSNSISIPSLNSNSSLVPEHELTIAVLHGHAAINPILATILSRLAATGFTILAHRQLSIPDHSAKAAIPLSPQAANALSLGHNLVYLLSRSRAIQVWKDLVGTHQSRPDLPARPGSLRFMFGSEAVWAAEHSALVADLLAALWPASEHLNHPQFANTSPLPNLHIPLGPVPSPEPSPRPQKRVFKFSRAVPPQNLLPITPCDQQADLSMANRSDGPTNANDDCQRPADSLGAGLAGLPSQPSVIDTGLTGEDDSGHGEMAQEALTRPTCSVDPSSPSAEPVSAAFSTLSVRSSGPPTPHSKPTHSPNLSQHTTVSSLASPLPSSSSFSSLPDPHSHPTSAHSSPDRLCAAPASPPSSSTSLSTAPPPADAPPTPRQRPMMLPHKPDGSLPFRARPVPATTAEPTVSPKMSKAALLRLGLPWSPPERPVASSHSSVSDTSTRPPIAPVASLGPPSVVPRPTRASTLRTGGGVAPESAAPRLKRSESKIFENTPGHGFRRAHLQTKVASCAAPKTEPRLNKASALRTGAIVPGGESGRDSPRVSCGSGQRLSGVSFEGVPGHRRKERIEVKATNRPEIEPRMTRASLLRIGGGAAVVAGRGGGSKKTAVGGVTRAGLGGKGGGVVGVAGGGGRNDGEGYGESEIEEEEGAYEGEDRSFVEEEEAESDSGEYSVECNKINGEEGDGEGSFEEEKEGGDCELSQEQGGEGERLNGGGDHYLHQQKEVGEGFGFVTILSHKSQLEQQQRQQLVSGGCKN